MNMNNMAMVNVNNLLNIKDSRWLQLEVCREYQRNKCTRPDTECKFAHPPANVEVQNGRVTACYDSIKGRCNREKPPCKYFHPPLHLKDQLLINGRNHLALKNALMQQMGLAPGQPVVPGQVPPVAGNPYLAGVTGQAYNPYFATGPLVPLVSDPTGATVVSPLGVPQQTVVQQKVSRGDRLDSYPGMVTYKRPNDKGGVPVYQPANNPSAAAYQQLMQLQQPFVPVSSASLQQAAAAASSNSGGNNNAAMNPSHQDGPQSAGLTNGGTSGGGNNNSNSDLHDDDGKGGESSAVKRMRTTNPSSSVPSSNAVAVSNAAVIAQNNAAYVAAAQTYHNALAAINYTGVALQTNKNAPQAPNPPASFPGASALQGSAALQQQQQQQAQQQQLLNQYQAMAAALANSAAFLQNPAAAAMNAAAAAGGQGQQQNLNSQAQGGLNPAAFASLAALNPMLAASLPQLAAAQRAGLMQGQQGQAMQGAQLNQLAGMQGGNPGVPNHYNPFTGAMQFANQGGGIPLQSQQQQALLAAYGQIARGPVPSQVSGGQSMGTQQLFVGNPAAAAAAAAAVAGNGGLQTGVKRMRPS